MFHHHEHEKQMTAAEREELLSEGTVFQAMVVRRESAAADRLMSQVRLSVDFKDGQRVEFSPPWQVPTHCPNRGAPVDQARASQDRDPHCEFCHQPVPVTPVR